MAGAADSAVRRKLMLAPGLHRVPFQKAVLPTLLFVLSDPTSAVCSFR